MRSGQIVYDQKHYWKMLVFRGDLEQCIIVAQSPNGAGTWNAPNMLIESMPTSLSAIDAECWADALLRAVKKMRSMNPYTGRQANN